MSKMKYSDFRPDYPYLCTKGNDDFSLDSLVVVSSSDGSCIVFYETMTWLDKEECIKANVFDSAEFEPAREYATSNYGNRLIHKDVIRNYVMWENEEND